MNRCLFAVIAFMFCAIPLAARADWDPCNPDPNTKFFQLPDTTGWDVKVTMPMLLADDFVCTETGWVTGIHFWGSWKAGIAGEITRIHLSFHADIPAGEITPYSLPGQELWSKEIMVADVPAGSVTFRDEDAGVEGWYEPNTGEYSQYDHIGMTQVNVFLDQMFPREELFIQDGAPGNPVTYWLDIQVDVLDPAMTDFGWKTSLQHHGPDYAVWSDWEPGMDKPWGDEWDELLDPVTGEGLDMAFVLTGIPIPEPGVLVVAGLGVLALLRRSR